MPENPLLALLAQLCGDITLANNADSNQLFQLQNALAASLISDPSLKNTSAFRFEQSDQFSAHHLNNVLQQAEEKRQTIDTTIRVFRREGGAWGSGF